MAQEAKSFDDEQNENVMECDAPPMPTHIILMGDSVLDDFYWLEDKSLDVRQQIWNLYGGEVSVTNLAVDESRSHDVLHGMKPSSVYSRARKQEQLDPYPVDRKRRGKVFPLDIVEQMIESGELETDVADDELKPTVVLSVGGNDVRAMLHNFSQQALAAGMAQLAQNAELIVKKLLAMQLNVAVVICYEPYHDFAPMYGLQREQLLQVINVGATQMFALCAQYGLPVIDLSRTFDPFDRTHYGSTSIEPSNKSGQFIADLVQRVHEDFAIDVEKGKKAKSKIYRGLKSSKAGIVVQKNNKKARDGYLAQLLAKKPPKHESNL